MNEKKAQNTQGRMQDVRGGIDLKRNSTICEAVHPVSNAECSVLYVRIKQCLGPGEEVYRVTFKLISVKKEMENYRK